MGLKVCKRIEQQFQLRSEVDRIEGITTDLSHFITPNAMHSENLVDPYGERIHLTLMEDSMNVFKLAKSALQ